jgi:hypothetical protein
MESKLSDYAEKIDREYTIKDLTATFGAGKWQLNGPDNTITLLDSGETLTAKQVVERVDAYLASQ